MTSYRFQLLVFTLFAACAPAAGGVGDPPGLDDDPGVAWRTVLHPETGLPTMIDTHRRGPPKADGVVVGEASRVASRFLVEHPGLFGPVPAGGGLDLIDVRPDGRGGARARFSLTVEGLPLEGATAVVVVAADGKVRAVAGEFPRQGKLAFAPALDAEAAGDAALDELEERDILATLALESPPVLLAFVRGGQILPAWRVVIAGEDGAEAAMRRELFVNAGNGTILHEREALWTARATGSGVGVDGERRQLDVFRAPDGTYQLRDDTRGAGGIRTYDAATRQLPGLVIRSDSPDDWDETGPGAGAAVDAHANAAIVFDFLADVLERKPLDGRGGGIRLSVHYGHRYANAFWDGRRVVFGDGDPGRTLPFAASLDIVAHELFHAVTEHDSGLIYEGESGALNESLSDVFATLVELDHGDGNWTIAEAITDPPFRDLADPERTHLPSHMNRYVRLPNTPWHDMGGVHVNSTIPSHAAYLLAVGGRHTVSGVRVSGIGVEKLRDIWYRAATIYLTPRARFADFAEATRTAAEDLFGPSSPVVRSVEDAWRAVGVTR